MNNANLALKLAQRLSGYMRGEALLLLNAKNAGENIQGLAQDAFDKLPETMVCINKLREGLAPSPSDDGALKQVLQDCEETGRMLYKLAKH